MKNNNITSNKFAGINAFQLKILGLILMVFDHIHQMFYMFGVPQWFNMLGRPVAPIFLFLSAEGFYHTRNKFKYMLRLWVASIIMGLLSIVIQDTFKSEIVLLNNIFSTIFLSIFFMWVIDNIISGVKNKKISQLLMGIGLFVLQISISFITLMILPTNPDVGRILFIIFPNILSTEGGYMFILLALSFYFLRKYGKFIRIVIPMAIVSILSFMSGQLIQPLMILAIIPLLMYNGQPGRKGFKYLFYVFYPAHIYAFYIISYFMQAK
ncbi:TraX family protein [Peptostreptococcus faecalis]|uniref:TraX family protein n=1 Tax=Peptostreptococcus faecalis TaxID=2045015 RepID=UPI000C79CF92|nr:TraX family protein [Peptostreptococcus faecalis]